MRFVQIVSCCTNRSSLFLHAVVSVAQLVELQIVDLDVAGSSPVAHPKCFFRFQLINFGATPSSSLNLGTLGNNSSSSFATARR